MSAEPPAARCGPVDSLRRHWPEYLCEAVLLAGFMVSACTFSVVLFHPRSSVVGAIESELLRRLLMGIAMGLTAAGLIYSQPGQRSGAHMNPALTLAFWRLGKVAGWDAAFYCAAQFLGGMTGVGVARLALSHQLASSHIQYAVTVPGSKGIAAAWLGEFGITLLLMLVVLFASNSRRLTGATGLLAALLLVIYITFEAPLSGMSMNPARTLGSALSAGIWTHWWIYFTAPPLAMLVGAETYLRMRGPQRLYCAKHHHLNGQRCIFRCDFARLMTPAQGDTLQAAPVQTGGAVNPPAIQPHQTGQTLYYG